MDNKYILIVLVLVFLAFSIKPTYINTQPQTEHYEANESLPECESDNLGLIVTQTANNTKDNVFICLHEDHNTSSYDYARLY